MNNRAVVLRLNVAQPECARPRGRAVKAGEPARTVPGGKRGDAMKTWAKGIAAAAILAVAIPAVFAFAEDPKADDDEGIQAYSVARLRVFKGTAWVRTPDSGEWEEFSTNSPIPERGRVSVPEGSEAELQFHGGQGMLLTAGSEIDVRQLGGERSAFRLRAGEIRFDLPETDFAPVAVVIPGGGNVGFPVPGRYWLTARDDGDAQLVVRTGQGTVTTGRGEFTVNAGDEATIGADVRIGPFSGGAAAAEPPVELSDAESQAGIPPYAAEELRDYGEWVDTPDYGYVWRPRVAVGWTPYYYGRWDWVSPFGWTWVSFEPWGWWPYHYGYWYSDAAWGWVWCPYRSFVSVGFTFGSHHTRHWLSRCDFAPSTVRFVRDGRSVRWVPLRPGERPGRVAFTRSDARLATWDRPLSPGKVFVRQGSAGSRVWRDYSTVWNERRPVVRESIGRTAPGGAPGAGRGPEMRRSGDRGVRGREGPPMVERPALERPAGRGGGTEPRRPEVAPRQERMNRDGRPAPRSRDSRLERRYGAGAGVASPAGRGIARDAGQTGSVPRTSVRQAERARQRGPVPGLSAREAPRTFGYDRGPERTPPRVDRWRVGNTGGRSPAPQVSGGFGGSRRGAEIDRAAPRGGGSWGGGGEARGFGSRGGASRGGGEALGPGPRERGSRDGGRDGDGGGFRSRGGGWGGGRSVR